MTAPNMVWDAQLWTQNIKTKKKQQTERGCVQRVAGFADIQI